MRFQRAVLLSAAISMAIIPSGLLRGQVIVGRLVDGESMQPVPQGFVQLMDSASFQASGTYSDEEGRFTLTAPGPGEYMIQVEAFSYYSMQDGPLTLQATDTVGVEFFILPDPAEMEPLLVEAGRTEFRLRSAGFYRRQERAMGQFITRENIDDIRAHDLSGLLAWGALGVMLRPNSFGIMVPAFPAGRSSTGAGGGGWCYPMYFLDGVPLTDATDEGGFFIHPNDVAGVEVYATRAETPAQYRDPRAGCGTILIWSRR